MLYKPPFDLYSFQWEIIEKALSQNATVIGADCGMGKSIMAIFIACYLLDNQQIDHIIWETEKNKFSEWEEDLANFSDLSVGKLNVNPEKRKLVIESKPQVLLGVYETIRSEAAVKMSVKSGSRIVQRWVPQMLTETLKGKRILLMMDEASAKIGANRGSALYKSHETMIKEFRKHGEIKFLCTTATPVNRDLEGWWNLARLLDPVSAGKVTDFEKDHVIRDQYKNVILFTNTDESNTAPGKKSLKEKTDHLIIFKRKTDNDVRHMFPKIETNVEYIDMAQDQAKFYKSLRKIDFEAIQLFTVMRQIAGHPQSMIRSLDNSKEPPELPYFLINKYGRDLFMNMSSTKLDRVVEILKENPDDQFAIFTFYGQSILPIISERLSKEGISNVTNHGGLSQTDRKSSQRLYRAQSARVFISSDAGSRGINLPSTRFVINYELPLTYSSWWQRINRANRLDSDHKVTTVIDLITKNSIEEGIVEIGLKRHAYSDVLLSDTEDGSNYISASVRKEILNFARDND